MIKKIMMFLTAVLFIPCIVFAEPSLQWDASIGTVDGYRVYYSNTSGLYIDTDCVDVGDVTITPISGIPHDNTTDTYFVVRAYNIAGESGDSNEVVFPTIPEVPGNVSLIP